VAYGVVLEPLRRYTRTPRHPHCPSTVSDPAPETVVHASVASSPFPSSPSSASAALHLGKHSTPGALRRHPPYDLKRTVHRSV